MKKSLEHFIKMWNEAIDVHVKHAKIHVLKYVNKEKIV
jgi:hypothetical protein